MTENESAYDELKSCYEIVLKTARRAARDLNHAIDHFPQGDDFIQVYRDRYQFYDLVFGGTQDYRANLYREIDKLEYELKKEMNRSAELEKRLKELSPQSTFDYPIVDGDIPF